MPRCLHMYDSGFQCIDESIEPTEFCEAHQKIVDFESLQDSPLRKLFYRLVAFILLLMFLIPLIYTIRNLYLGPPAKAQEVW
jgi:hypothetical protein